jgi:uroporphyrin-III C-methyltransferase
MSLAEKGKVYLVGAGPGDPELLTVRALRLLESADVVLHDDLVSAAVLQLANPRAAVTSVGKRFGQAKITQAEIHTLMIDAARAGHSVVRLKSGDPLIFGRAGEEFAALRAAGIPFAVVPGITAALAAGAMLGLPLTERTSASKLIFLTGHHAAESGRAPLWTGTLPDAATLVLYMPGRDLGRIARELAAAGVHADTPCCAVSHVATAQQTHAACRLADLPLLVCGPAPLLLLVGHSLEPVLAT